MLSCKEVTGLVSDSLDRALPVRQRMAVRMHLLLCKACARYERQLLFIREVVRRLPEDGEHPPSPSAPALPTAARERIRRSLDAQISSSSPDNSS